MKYYATISRNFRDVATGDPKVLLRSINNELNEEFRDHCWVSSNALNDVIPYKNHQHLRISFEADEKQYYSGKVTLKNITNVSIVKHKR